MRSVAAAFQSVGITPTLRAAAESFGRHRAAFRQAYHPEPCVVDTPIGRTRRCRGLEKDCAGVSHPQQDFFQRPLGDVMHTGLVAPVGEFVGAGAVLQHDGLAGVPQGDDEDNFEVLGDFERLAEPFVVDRAHHATAQPCFGGGQEHALGDDAAVPLELPGDSGVAQDDDVAGGTFALGRARPVGQRTCPAEMLEDAGVLLGLPGDNVLQRLAVGRRGAQSGQVDQAGLTQARSPGERRRPTAERRR